MLKGLVFDMDGTLVDNLDYHFRAFEEYVRREGLTLIEPLSLRINGMHSDDVFRILLGEEACSRLDLDKVNVDKERVYRQMYSGNVRPIEGLIELLKEAKSRGIKCAIGSSGCRENVEFIISELGIEEYIDASVSGSDVTHGKPHPEIFNTAIERLGLQPEECIVVEDAINGVKAGVAAHCKTFALTTTASAEVLLKAGAALCVKDFTEISIESLEALLKG